MKEHICPSGAVLRISDTPFAVSKALYQAVLEECKHVKLSAESGTWDLMKDLFCIGFSSKKIEVALEPCLKRCTYNDGRGDFKIDDTTFESTKAREDYSTVMIEVIRENIMPFTKGLFAEFKRLSAMMPESPGSRPSSLTS